MQNHHPEWGVESRFGLFQQVFLEPASLRLLVLEDQDLVRRRFQQGILRRLDRVGIAHLAAGLDAVRAELFEHPAESRFGFPLGLVDVAQRVSEGGRLDSRNHHAQADLVALVMVIVTGADLAQRLGTDRVAGDYREQSTCHRSSTRSRRMAVVGFPVLDIASLLRRRRAGLLGKRC